MCEYESYLCIESQAFFHALTTLVYNFSSKIGPSELLVQFMENETKTVTIFLIWSYSIPDEFEFHQEQTQS